MFSAFKLQPFHLLVVFAFNEEGFQEVDGQIQDDEEHQRVASSQLSLIFLANRAPTNWKSWNAIFFKDWVYLNESNFPLLTHILTLYSGCHVIGNWDRFSMLHTHQCIKYSCRILAKQVVKLEWFVISFYRSPSTISGVWMKTCIMVRVLLTR